jgi:hypothetical protein
MSCASMQSSIWPPASWPSATRVRPSGQCRSGCSNFICQIQMSALCETETRNYTENCYSLKENKNMLQNHNLLPHTSYTRALSHHLNYTHYQLLLWKSLRGNLSSFPWWIAACQIQICIKRMRSHSEVYDGGLYSCELGAEGASDLETLAIV